MKVTQEMVEAFGAAWDIEDAKPGKKEPGARRRAGIAAVLAIVERDGCQERASK